MDHIAAEVGVIVHLEIRLFLWLIVKPFIWRHTNLKVYFAHRSQLTGPARLHKRSLGVVGVVELVYYDHACLLLQWLGCI